FPRCATWALSWSPNILREDCHRCAACSAAADVLRPSTDVQGPSQVHRRIDFSTFKSRELRTVGFGDVCHRHELWLLPKSNPTLPLVDQSKNRAGLIPGAS